MTSTRSTSIAVGALFLTQTIAFIAAEQLIKRALNGPEYLTSAAGSTNALALGALLAFVSGVAVVGIARGFRSSERPRTGDVAPLRTADALGAIS